MIGRNDPCWCGSGKKWKKCHHPEPAPKTFASQKEEYRKKYKILLKTPEQIEGIRRAGKLTAEILEATCAKAKAGVTTGELNAFAHQLHVDAGARPAPLHYGEPPFPKSICTSLNDVICHGIPDDVPLKDGDIMNIDVSAILDGYYGDCSRMVCVGSVDPDKQRVVDTAYECLMRSIEILKPGIPVFAIGDVIQDYADSQKCSVAHQFVGHGVGLEFHEGPQIPHCRNRIGTLLVPGMTFTIEPMINAGVADGYIEPENDWVARTIDHKPSAQWEHMLLITEDGCEILTPWTR